VSAVRLSGHFHRSEHPSKKTLSIVILLSTHSLHVAFCGIGACVFLKYRPPTLNATTLIVSTERHRFTTRARKFGPCYKPSR